MNAVAPIAELARSEVIALHEFFVAWFRGEGSVADFVLCERALADDFRMVTPDGEVHGRDAVLQRLRSARGTMTADFSISVLDPRPVWATDAAVLLEYVERQYRDGRWTRRRSTALFTRSPAAPRGVEWRHLQETWMKAAQETNA